MMFGQWWSPSADTVADLDMFTLYTEQGRVYSSCWPLSGELTFYEKSAGTGDGIVSGKENMDVLT